MIWSRFFCVYPAIFNSKALRGRTKALGVGALRVEVLKDLGWFDYRGFSWFE